MMPALTAAIPAVPAAARLLQNDPRIRPCKTGSAHCYYSSIAATRIPGVVRGEDTRTLWGYPKRSYGVRISGKAFYVVSMMSGGSLGSAGVILYRAGNPRYVAAFREISIVRPAGKNAYGEAAWSTDARSTLFGFSYDQEHNRIDARVIGSKPNCGFSPPANNGIEIGECRKIVQTVLLQAVLPANDIFRKRARYTYADAGGPWDATLRVQIRRSLHGYDSLSMRADRADTALREADAEIFYTGGAVEKTRFSMTFRSSKPEVLASDLINAPNLFPQSEQMQFLSRGLSAPKSSGDTETHFHYRSENGDFIVLQRIVETTLDAVGTKTYLLRASVELTGRSGKTGLFSTQAAEPAK